MNQTFLSASLFPDPEAPCLFLLAVMGGMVVIGHPDVYLPDRRALLPIPPQLWRERGMWPIAGMANRPMSVQSSREKTITRGARSRADKAHEETRIKDLCSELAAVLNRRTVTDGGHETAIPELKFYRFSNPTEPTPVLQQPAVYVVVQGRKEVRSATRHTSMIRLNTSLFRSSFPRRGVS